MVFQSVLGLHVVAGVVALVAASLALFTAKGKTAHVRAGLTYVAGMGGVTLTALVLVVLRPNLFLGLVALFSFWLVLTGWRAARIRDGQPRPLDRALVWGMVVVGLGMVGLGLAGMAGLTEGAGSRSVVLVVFGGIGLVSAVADLRAWRAGPATGTARLARHLTRMLGGTIATVTAVVTVNAGFLPELARWLGPTVVMVPLIVWWNVRLARRSPTAPGE